MDEEEFIPQLGKMRSRGATGKRYAHQLVRAINRAGGRRSGSGGFSGKRFGRGGVEASLLASRDRYSAFRQRRVMVKARIVKLAGKGMNGAAAHLRYIQRDGVTREGDRGELYGPDKDRMDGKTFLERSKEDRHQFRFIVAPEDGREYDDLKPLTRRLMTQMEQDLDTHLDWVAVDHFNTGHPHAHILLRGKDDKGDDLVIAPSYMSTGIRERAAELVRIDLGPRTDREIEMGLNAEIDQDRLTSLDRQLLRMKEVEKSISTLGLDAERQTLLTGRLRHLERLGLGEERRSGQWHLEDDAEDTLRRMGEKGDIIKTMHREMTERNIARNPADYAIYDPLGSGAKSVTGKVIARGLSDELNDRHYLIVDSMDGRALYIDIGRGDLAEPTPEGCIVQVTPRNLGPRQVDRTVMEVATANGGHYTVDLHLKFDERATDTFAETHIRRLEAIRKLTNGVEREPDGTWIIKPDHLDRAAEYERAQARRMPVTVEKLSGLTLEQQVGTDGATWLDRELVAGRPAPSRDVGFGKEMREAMERRQKWLIEQDLAREEQSRIYYRRNMLSELRKREIDRVAESISEQLGLSYTEARQGELVEGTLRRSIELASGKVALVQKTREFTLVPWRPVLEQHIGKQISGIMRSDGVSWTIGRQRGIGIS